MRHREHTVVGAYSEHRLCHPLQQRHPTKFRVIRFERNIESRSSYFEARGRARGVRPDSFLSPRQRATPILFAGSPSFEIARIGHHQCCVTTREVSVTVRRNCPVPLRAAKRASSETLPGPKISTTKEAIRNV
jgi:hypothetical protein